MVQALTVTDLAVDFPHAAQVAKITRHRTNGKTDKRTRETVYVIADLTSRQASPQRLAVIVRSQWTIENRLHFVRDTTFAEDACKIRTGHGPENMAPMHNYVINLLRAADHTNIAAAIHEMSYDPLRPSARPPQDQLTSNDPRSTDFATALPRGPEHCPCRNCSGSVLGVVPMSPTWSARCGGGQRISPDGEGVGHDHRDRLARSDERRGHCPAAYGWSARRRLHRVGPLRPAGRSGRRACSGPDAHPVEGHPLNAIRAATVVGELVAGAKRHGATLLMLEFARNPRPSSIAIAVRDPARSLDASDTAAYIDDHELLMASALAEELFATVALQHTGTAFVAHLEDATVAAPSPRPLNPWLHISRPVTPGHIADLPLPPVPHKYQKAAHGSQGRTPISTTTCEAAPCPAWQGLQGHLPMPCQPDGSTPGSPSPSNREERDILRSRTEEAPAFLATAQVDPALIPTPPSAPRVIHQLDGRMLDCAIERARAEESTRRLAEEEQHRQDNVRLQQNLLPTPLLQGSDIEFFSRYRPGRRRAVLGGDFYDAVRTPDGTDHIAIGDVCGHGSEEAALSVALRIAWRTLILAGLTGEALLHVLQQVLEHERRSEEIFATVCMLAISPDGGRAELYLAGHPAPILLPREGAIAGLLLGEAGPALGMLPTELCTGLWQPQQVRLGTQWGLMLYTDGLMEGRTGAGSDRLGQDGLLGMVGFHRACGLTHDQLLDRILIDVEKLNEGPLSDDVAVLLLERHAMCGGNTTLPQDKAPWTEAAAPGA